MKRWRWEPIPLISKKNEHPPLILTELTKHKRPRHMTLEIQVLAWDILKTEAHYFCFVCHHHVSCVLNVACARGLSILDSPLNSLSLLLTLQVILSS